MTPQFLKLSWNEDDECWTGTVRFADRELNTLIDFDVHEPSASERERATECAKALLATLSPEWELACRKKAAEEIAAAAYGQLDAEMPEAAVDELLADMELDGLEFSYAPEDDETIGILEYLAPNCFPGMNLQVNFLDDLSIDEIMLTD